MCNLTEALVGFDFTSVEIGYNRTAEACMPDGTRNLIEPHYACHRQALNAKASGS